MYTQSEWEDEMSLRILGFVRNELYLELRFMDMALSGLKWKCDESIDTMAVDGDFLFYSPMQLIRVFKNNSKFLNRLYLHSILHCIYSHLWLCGSRNRMLWDIACDIVVEYTIDSIDKDGLKRPLSWLRKQFYDKIGSASAAKVYNELKKLDREDIEKLRAEFYTDSHKYWPKEEKQSKSQSSSQNKWDKISRQLSIALDSRGDDTKEGVQIFNEQVRADRSRRSYREFLRKFAVLREELHCDDDEFDLNYYTYGLKLYGNMPLIEPLETREVMKIQEFVVVIDTSYSTSGELVKNFLKETYTILSENNSFFSNCHMRILQCDNDVRSDIDITDSEKLSHILENFNIIGGGSTDFRPAFRYVNKLIEDKVLKNMKGLIYFTDGKGVYPGKRPDYKTVFVFADDYDNTAVPPWAMRFRIESM